MASLPKPFWSRRYRFYLWAHRHFHIRDVLQFLMALSAAALAINAYSFRKSVTVVAGLLYLAALLIFYALLFRSRVARDQLQGDLFWRLFDEFNKSVFSDDHRTRFTLFRFARWRPSEIVPRYRYRKGDSDSITEALKSRAHYKRGESLTGQAWDVPAKKLFMRSLPVFETRNEFAAWYTDKLHIRKEVVDLLSDHMIGVQTIFAYGMVDDRSRLLGVLSIDLCAPVIREESGSITFSWRGRRELNSHRQ